MDATSIPQALLQEKFFTEIVALMNLKRSLLGWVFCGLIIISLCQTYALMKVHFTHVDDFGVANTLMMPNKPLSSGCLWRFEVLQNRLPTISLLTEPFKNFTCSLPGIRERMGRVSDQWTYAPFQFLITQALLNPGKAYTYEDIKYLGRLPSFFFFIFGLGAFYCLLKSKFQGIKEVNYLPLALTLLLTFSLEQRIMASQMESYAIGILANAIALWGMLSLRDLGQLSYLKISSLSLVLALAISMQYQSILLIVAGLMALSVCQMHRSWRWVKSFIFCIVTVILFAYMFIGDISHLSNRGVSWNKGIGEIFLVHGDAFFERLSSLITLIFWQTPYNIYSITSPLELGTHYANIFGFFITLFCILGICYLYVNRKDDFKKFILILGLIYCGIFLSFIFVGKLTYSPTRHLLFYLPLVIIYLGYGIVFILEHSPSHMAVRFFTAIVVTYCVISVIRFDAFYQKRIDAVSTRVMNSVLGQFDADFIYASRWDFDMKWLIGAKNIPFYRHLVDEGCKNAKRSSLNNLKKIHFITFGRHGDFDFQNPALQTQVKEIVTRCLLPPGERVRINTFQRLGQVLQVNSNTEIDLSNKTSNGTNGLYISWYEITLQ